MQKRLQEYRNERDSYEQNLQRKNAELEQFAYIASHDLKAPLRAIDNLASWIIEDNEEKLEEESRKNLNLLRDRVSKMSELINGILQYSRAGRMNIEVKTIDLKELLTEIIAGLDIPNTMSVALPSQSIIFDTPAIPLTQIFSNLINNAVKYQDKPNGTIQITVEDIGKQYKFSIADDGPGIDPQYHQKIFAIFQSLKPTDSTHSTGIGLAIVKKIVENFGGKIGLISAPGKGSIFSFTWPKMPLAVEAASANATPPATSPE